MTDQDREDVVEHVTTAYAEGRLDKAEFDERLHRAMTARTHGDLAPIMRDLYPAGMPRTAPAPPSAVPAWHPVPLTAGDRLGAAAAHVLPFFGLSFVGPLIMLLTGGRTSPYIRRHAVEALNFHLTVLGASVALPLTVVGIVLLPLIWIAAFVLGIVAGAMALGDSAFRYPLTVRLVK
ncbi:hypothetical protein Sru01_60080 [Sphaerisporangium rufum]|uniref:DUF1707 domain-containing protein n=1 Tax=Sphaerisporangium rufum TaxID=1381558 RepID=A0A919V1E7_9ACTN|nr:DUF1707 and DUF4870 domain-containing protein [Sphaerisporangium rufum]GII81026.1 hypothetical protein Sru01_60080 [Sphaerisporangium rufum]